MEHRTDTYTDQRGTTIYTQSWLPDGPVRATVVVVHGLGDHSGRYGNLIGHLVPQGYALYSMDLPNHGRSSGTRLYVERFAHYVETVDEVRQRARAEQPEGPLFMLGHSVGGLILSNYLCAGDAYQARQEGLAGAVISSPAVAASDNVGPMVMWASKALSAIAPKIGIKDVVDPVWISRDPEVVRAYVEDPLVSSGKLTARLGAELIAAQGQVLENAARISLPVLVIQGGEDRVISPAGAQVLYETIRSPDKTIQVYDGLYHECMNEPERAEVLGDIERWLEAHVG